jgi:hypothetical protein
VSLRCFGYLLTFLLLTATAPQGVSSTRAHAHDDPTAVDEAPAENVSIGNKTPDPTAVESFTVFKALRSQGPHWPVIAHTPALVRRPRYLRRAISRQHWVRRRVPRLRDDAPDH